MDETKPISVVSLLVLLEGGMLYPPFCLRARDERAVPGPATLLLCTRSLEARLRDEASTAENSCKESKQQDFNQRKHQRRRDGWREGSQKKGAKEEKKKRHAKRSREHLGRERI